MAVLDLQTTKDYLRIEHSADDTLLAALIASALAAVEAWLGRPIELREHIATVDTYHPYSDRRYSAQIFLPLYPVSEITAMEDGDGTVIVLDTLRVDSRSGLIRKIDNTTFCNPPYEITATVGLQALPEYTAAILPAVRMGVLDTVADLYQRRNPAAMSEREGGGVAVQYGDPTRGIGADTAREDMITPRTAALIAPWRVLGVSL